MTNALPWSFLVVPVGAGALLLAAFAWIWHNDRPGQELAAALVVRFSLRMILSENRFPLFGIMRYPAAGCSLRFDQPMLVAVALERDVAVVERVERRAMADRDDRRAGQPRAQQP